MSGTFIVVEGFDGVGKSTLARGLAERIRAAGFEVLEVREPGGTPLAEAARAAVLDPRLDATAEAELFLILAARADLVRRVIVPALEDGVVVISDRFDLSTTAYQVAGRLLPREAVTSANRLATGGLLPDVLLVLDAPLELAIERRAAEETAPDRIEQMDDQVRERIARAFREASGDGVVHLDATGSPAEVEAAAWDVVHSRLSGTRPVSAC
ncbi:MAG: dTMP kinase [Gemmatimonadota bacterium]|nr:MAG: dTMP kinase [Gemmatimonadota bacterium]